MKQTFSLLIYFIALSTIFGQQKMNITFEARYELNFKEYKNQKPDFLKNTFILLGNERESFFKNMSVYVKDSLLDYGKIRETGDIQKDFETFGKYVPDLPFTVFFKEGQIKFTNQIESSSYYYEEPIDFKWKITKELKNINGIKCIKATTTKWGRNWIAYYSPKHAMPFGPYKFNGLPGLIFEIYDEKKDYNFLIYKYKKRVSNNFITHQSSKSKKTSKIQYEKIRKQAAIHPYFLTNEKDAKLLRKGQQFLEEKEKNYNPIELTD